MIGLKNALPDEDGRQPPNPDTGTLHHIEHDEHDASDTGEDTGDAADQGVVLEGTREHPC